MDLRKYRLELGLTWTGSPPEWRRFIDKLEEEWLLADDQTRKLQIVENLKKFNALYVSDSNYTVEFDSYEDYIMWVLAYS